MMGQAGDGYAFLLRPRGMGYSQIVGWRRTIDNHGMAVSGLGDFRTMRRACVRFVSFEFALVVSSKIRGPRFPRGIRHASTKGDDVPCDSTYITQY